MSGGAKETYFDFVLHHDSPPLAEWDVYWNERDEAGRISSGTAPSIHSAIDHAIAAFDAYAHTRSDAGQAKESSVI